LALVLIFLPMFIIPILFAVLVIRYKVESERSFFSEALGAKDMQQKSYVLLDIPASENPQEMAQDEH